MTVASENIRLRLSGGPSNSDPSLSLGGGASSEPVPVGLFGPVTSAKSTAGSVDHRLVYFRNVDPDPDGVLDPVVWIPSNTPSADTLVEVGLDPSGKNVVVDGIPGESTPPPGVVFTEAPAEGSGIVLPGSPYREGDFVGVWVRRTVRAGAMARDHDPATIRVAGDTYP